MLIDLRHLSRSLRRSPASALAAVLTLALTLGAGASIFAIVDAVLLTPPPFTDPDALVVIGETPADEPVAARRAVRYATVEAWRERVGSLATIEAFDGTNVTLTELGAAERLSVTDVTPGFLPLLGVAPARGRMFDADDEGRPVVMISDRFWRTRLSADPDAIGRVLVLGGQRHVIVGILPGPFTFALSPADVWRALPLAPASAARAGYRVGAVARLAPSVSSTAIAAMLDDVSLVSSPAARATVTGIAAAITGDAPRTLGLLAGSAAITLIVAFTNLAGLLIVRSIDRRRELAVRTALGARPLEIVRQLILEAEALVALGIAGGVWLALWITPLAGRVVLEQFGGIAREDVAVSWRAIAVVAALAMTCAALCGWLPTFGRGDVVDVLRRGATAAPRELTWRRILVTGEVALAFVLLVCVTMLGTGLWRLLHVDPGFDARGVLTLQVSLPTANYPSAARVASFYTSLQHALGERLGSGAVSIVNEIPLTGDGGRRRIGIRPSEVGLDVVVRETGVTYFDVMRIPVIAGRTFDERDDRSAPLRVILSGSLAGRLFTDESPVGRHVWLSGPTRSAEVIGVVGDVKHRALDEDVVSTLYLPASQSPSPSSIVVTRSLRSDADVMAVVREEVARLDRDLPVYRTRTMRDIAAASPGVPARRVLTATFLGFAVLALVLGAVGLFGVLAHDVARRRTELALRLALGADPMRLLRATLAQGVVMVGGGLAFGGLLSFWAVRTLGAMLTAADRVDLVSVGVATAALVVSAAAAVLPAALRAARTDPLIALRAD